jgi:DNA polymerase-1
MLTLLIDSAGVGYRAFHSLGGLSHEGIATGVAFGFLSLILDLSEKYKTNQLIFCWDSPGSVRKQWFPEYKMSRDTKTPEEKVERAQIHAQFDALRQEILPAIGFSNNPFQLGYEADDLIASIIIDNPTKSFVVVSSDHDLYQLLQYHNCKAQHRLSGKEMTASKFMEEYRLPAREWATVKAIAGCDGDGVPGIPGVGELTAIKYLLDELNEGKKKESIEGSPTIIRRNYKLVHLPFPGVEKIKLEEDRVAEETMFSVFSDLGFESFMYGEQERRWEQFCKGEWK